MKLQDTYDEDAYEVVNVRITDVLFGTHKLSVLLEGYEEDYGAEFPAIECFRDLMVLLGVQEFSEVEGSFVRVLLLGPRLVGLANIVTDRTMIFSDYERHGERVEPTTPTEPKEDETHPPSRRGRSVGAADIYNQKWHEIIRDGGTRAVAHEQACEAMMSKPKAPEGDMSDVRQQECRERFPHWLKHHFLDGGQPGMHKYVQGLYERDEARVLDHTNAGAGGAEIFTMASIEPPPGLPWEIRSTAKAGWCLFPAVSVGPLSTGRRLAQHLDPALIDWLVNEAKIATQVKKS